MGKRINNHTLAQRVREATAELGRGGEIFTVSQLLERMGMAQVESRQPLYTALRDLRRGGELERIERCRYRLLKRPDGGPSKQEIMWRLLRMRRLVSVEDLVELAGVSAHTAREWLKNLVRTGVATRGADGKWRVLKDQPAMPPNQHKAAKLRRMRERKKAALEALERAQAAIREARAAIIGIDGD
jgi:predicted transcriptional regulator of viral defense system